MSKLEEEIFATLGAYLRQCKEDYEDRWITREVLHALMAKHKVENHDSSNF